MKPLTRRAFTLVELLVVVAIIALLIAILLPALGKAKENARRAVCGSQLKGQGVSMAIYAAEFNNLLPQGGIYDCAIITATWLHDGTTGFGDTLIGAQTSMNAGQSTGGRKWFYCPSNQDYNTDANWSGGNSATIPGSNPAVTVQKRRYGYTYLNQRGMSTTQFTASGSIFPSQRVTPPLDWRNMLNVNNASQLEVVEDLILNVNQPTSNSMSWAVTTNSASGSVVYTTSVSHMGSSNPAGANVLALDGHAEWRPWGGVSKIHYTACGGGPSGTVYFVLLDP